MSTVEDIEKAIERLPPEQLEQFRAWFEAYDSDQFDRKIERDAADGTLDSLMDEARAAFRQGRTTDL